MEHQGQDEGKGKIMLDKYHHFCFFKQRIVRKKGSQKIIKEDEYESLLRCKRGETYVFQEKSLVKQWLIP